MATIFWPSFFLDVDICVVNRPVRGMKGMTGQIGSKKLCSWKGDVFFGKVVGFGNVIIVLNEIKKGVVVQVLSHYLTIWNYSGNVVQEQVNWKPARLEFI